MYNLELKEELLYNLPNYEIARIANKITVITDKGKELIIKDRGLDIAGEVRLTAEDRDRDLIELLKMTQDKNVIVEANYYLNKKFRKILSEI